MKWHVFFIFLIVTFFGGLLFFIPSRNVTIAGGEPSVPDALIELREAIEVLEEKTAPSATSSLSSSFCVASPDFFDKADEQFCSRPPKANAFRLFEIDLSNGRIFFYENGLLQKTLPVAYQAPYGAWYQTPTGYFQIGVKRQSFMSSIFPVYMDWAVQLYEDFFVHGIPYHPDGTKVTSQFSGGCIRLEDASAKEFYDLVERGDVVISYTTLQDETLREGFESPVDQNNFWIRQRFNSPLKTDWRWHEDKRENYIQHAGIDFAPNQFVDDLRVRAVHEGRIVSMTLNGDHDRGLGNVIIVRHVIEGEELYALYGHLDSFEKSLKIGDEVVAGTVLGEMGNTGYGCEYWRIGEDGCSSKELPDIHLHFEIKSSPTLDAPQEDVCAVEGNEQGACVGYTSDNPWEKGYKDPLRIIFSDKRV